MLKLLSETNQLHKWSLQVWVELQLIFMHCFVDLFVVWGTSYTNTTYTKPHRFNNSNSNYTGHIYCKNAITMWIYNNHLQNKNKPKMNVCVTKLDILDVVNTNDKLRTLCLDGGWRRRCGLWCSRRSSIDRRFT